MSTLTVQQAFQLALQHYQAGRLAEAEGLYRQILAVQPNWAEAWQMLGILANQTGRPDFAVELLSQALAIEPGNGAAHSNLGLVYRSMGRLQDAVKAYERALQLLPKMAEPYHNLGNLLRQLGRMDEAVALLQQAIQLRPSSTDMHKNLGDTLSEADRRVEAIAAYREAIRLNPAYTEAYNNLGNALRKERRPQEALEPLMQARRIAPEAAEIHHNLAAVFVDLGRFDDADEAYREAIRIKPAFPEALLGWGCSLVKQGRRGEAAGVFRKAIEIAPDFVKAWNNLGNILREMGQVDEALAIFRRAIAIKPDYADVYSNLANALRDQGDLDGAVDAHRWARHLQPKNAWIQSNLIYSLHFHPRADAAALAAEQRAWQNEFGYPPRRFDDWTAVDRTPERQLRIGYVGADFRHHVVGWNLLPLFKEHDRSEFEIFCYSSVAIEDALTEQFRGLCDHWRSTAHWTDLEMAEMIRRDGIDVLVDLSQHMAGNRLRLFTRRPAPVQVSFAGYPESTGVEAIGRRISDRHLESESGDRRSEEPQLRSSNSDLRSAERICLLDSFWCYDPHGAGIPVNEAPAKSNGFATFGSLNHFSKVNPDVLQLWARVLAATAESRLILLSHAGSHRDRTVEIFEKEGVAASRIEFVEPRPREDYLRLYHRLDIMLDPFPYNGHTTSLDALWMGVPVVSLVGPRAVSRAGLSQLTNLGLPELVARTEDEYVDIARKLAGDLPRLAELRATLRPRMEASVLMNAKHFARQIEAGYRTMWRQWCAENPVS